MKKYRIVKKIADWGEYWYFPEYYVDKYFFGLLGGKWVTIKEWGGCDPLGFDYGEVDVYFKKIEDAEKYIKDIEYKPEIIKYITYS